MLAASPVPDQGGQDSPHRSAIRTESGFFHAKSWPESALLGFLVIPGAIVISVLLTCLLLAAILVLLAQLAIRGMRAGQENRTNIMAGP